MFFRYYKQHRAINTLFSSFARNPINVWFLTGRVVAVAELRKRSLSYVSLVPVSKPVRSGVLKDLHR